MIEKSFVSYLSVLGQVEGGDLLGLLQLLLVALDLGLELVHQGLHALVVLPVLLLAVAKLLDLPLGPPDVLLRLRHPPVLRIHLTLQLLDPCLHLGDGLATSCDSNIASFIFCYEYTTF